MIATALFVFVVVLSPIYAPSEAYGEDVNKSTYSDEEKAIFKEGLENGVNVFVKWMEEGYDSYNE